MRLIGTVYFKKYGVAFSEPSPVALFNKHSKNTVSPLAQHNAWLEDIRQSMWDRTQFEDDMMPSTEALYRHWKRVCWVIDMWRQANRPTLELRPLTEFGWRTSQDKLIFDWDSQENVDSINERVSALLKGCKCRTGCSSTICGCRKKGKKCSVGCSCMGCTNIPFQSTATSEQMQISPELTQISLEEEITTADHLNQEVDDLMEWVFGNEEETDSCSVSDMEY